MSDKSHELIDQKKNIYIQTGTELSLSVEGLGSPLKCTFVGKKKEQYIVVTPPSNFSAVENDLLPNKRIQIHYIFEGNVFQFTSKLMEITSTPLKLLLLEYPDSVENRESRAHKRIRCFISAKIELNNETKVGVIKDISKRGCRCVFDAAKNYENILQIDDCITLSFCFPGIVDTQEIPGKIKDIHIKEEQLEFGLEFADIAWWVPPYD